MSRRTPLFALLTLGLLLVACAPRGPLRTFNAGDVLAEYPFTRSSEFEQGTYAGASLLVRDGVYRVEIREGDNELWWGQWGDTYDNVVIDVDVEQLSTRNENAYGIMCRVRGAVGQPVDASDLALPPDATAEATAADEMTPNAEATDADVTPEAEATDAATEEATEAAAEATDTATEDAAEATSVADAEATPESTAAATADISNGDGYLFLIQGGGSYGIFRARGRDLTPLVNWQTSEAVNVGPNTNHLRAVCMGDYLAFYVNDTLVADTTDSTYQRGQVGLAASAANRIGALIEFDNLTVTQANAG